MIYTTQLEVTCVGAMFCTSSLDSCFRIVVFPALSRPKTNSRACMHVLTCITVTDTTHHIAVHITWHA